MMEDTKIDVSGEMDIKEAVETKFKGLAAVSGAAAKQWLFMRRQQIRPWYTFLNTTKFRVPESSSQITKRIIRNVDHFQSNYLFVFIGLAVYCLLTSPLLLIALGACLGACYIIHLKNSESPLRVLGYELNLAQQYAAVGVCSVPIFLLAGAGSAIFWLIGASLFFILLHASFFAVETLSDQEFLPLETV